MLRVYKKLDGQNKETFSWVIIELYYILIQKRKTKQEQA